MTEYSVRLIGNMHSFSLFNGMGEPIFCARVACRVAEDMFGNEWAEVYNGETGCSREEWLAECGAAI